MLVAPDFAQHHGGARISLYIIHLLYILVAVKKITVD